MKSSPFKIVVIITLIVVALIVALVVLNNTSESNEGKSLDKQPSIKGQPTLGDSDAPVTVVEFGDFSVPHVKHGEKIYSHNKKVIMWTPEK